MHELCPEKNVLTGKAGLTSAASREPWLRLISFDPRWAGRFIEITYRSSLLDEPARPIFRFWQRDGTFVDRIGSAAILGANRWTGRVPSETISLGVSPTCALGRFDFGVEDIRKRSWASLIGDSLLRSPGYAWRAFVLRMIGYRPESDAMLAWGLSWTDTRHFAVWSLSRRRAFDREGMDRPRVDWSQNKVICVLPAGGTSRGRSKTLASLRSQIFANWSAVLVEGGDDDADDDPRIEAMDSRALLDHAGGWSDASLVCVLAAGDTLPSHALAYLVEQARRNPDDRVFYGDVLETRYDGVQVLTPLPGWSRRLHSDPSRLRSTLFVRAAFLQSIGFADAFLATGQASSEMLSSRVRHLRRILIERSAAQPVRDRSNLPADTNLTSDGLTCETHGATATVVIPTRNNLAMLRRLVASIVERTCRAALKVLIVNNGGPRERIDVALVDLSAKASIKVVDYDDRFNFSAICNLGAACSSSEVIVFLNDDMEILSGDWLDRLVAHALAPDVGAVGAKLTYPNGKLQHVGIVVGMAESAGHFGARARGNSAGWAGRNHVVHEVSAVTGACLAVARQKFEAIGGFDADRFPVELGDVDLCLRLNERGWQTLLDPHVHIMHAESESRGRATFRPLAMHASERSCFQERWRHVLRNDPHFHPGMSLYCWQPALG